MSFDHYHGRKDFFGAIGRYKVDGVIPGVATTPSAQGAGAGGLTVVRVNETAGLLRVPKAVFQADKRTWIVDDKGPVLARGAQVDTVLANANGWVTLNQERYAALIAYYDVGNDTVAVTPVAGDAAAFGAAASPTTAQIEAAVGGSHVPWMMVYRVRVRRTGDVVLALQYEFDKRPMGIQRADGERFSAEL